MMMITKKIICVLVSLLIYSAVQPAYGYTDPRDVYAINQLYASMGFPSLTGWIPVGGDPCGPPAWQGVECVNANITAIKLNRANLGGMLSDGVGLFASIMQIDLSDNQIGGTIPADLPITLQGLFLSGNMLSGDIPDISSLGQLTDLSLNDNKLSGSIPDSFESLKSLINMDLSGNSLTGELPPSIGNLSSLTTLHLQNNQLTGMLNVLQDLPLIDLNIENNLFSGPIPIKLLNVPNFRRAGNPFNTSVIESPPDSSFSLSPSEAPFPQLAPGIQPRGPSVSPVTTHSDNNAKKNTKNKITWIAISGLVIVIVLLLVLCLSMFRCCKKRSKEKTAKRLETGSGLGSYNDFAAPPPPQKRDNYSQNQLSSVAKGTLASGNKVALQPTVRGSHSKTLLKHNREHSIDMTRLDDTKALPFSLLPSERILANPTFSPVAVNSGNAPKTIGSAKFFSIASLQQYTDSFSQDNLVGRGTLGAVYRAQLFDGKVLAVKKLDKAASGYLTDRDFLELVSNISKLRHSNIVELVGYCLEHGQCLLVYSYCKNGTLDEALNVDDEINNKLSWNTRMHLALQAARALEYLHEVCQPSIMHRNFKSSNILLEDDLSVRVSDCGLAPLLPPNSMTQLQSSGYGAPELESGNYSYQSDVYSFGVMMLQLLTGRKSYDGSRPRGEQYLVRWAFSRLHDIDALSRMVDPSLKGAYPSKSLSRVADIISLCIQPEPEFRPPMSEIVQKLLKIA